MTLDHLPIFQRSKYKLRWIFTLLGLAVHTLGNGQANDTLANDFLRSFFYERYSINPIIYTAGIDSYVKKEMIRSISISDTLRSQIGTNAYLDSLVITEEERIYIIQEIESLSDTSLWNPIHIADAIYLSRDSVDSIFSDGDRYWEYFEANYGRYLREFSVPVFFRNNEFCAFYWGYTCPGLCGSAQFSIFRKNDNHWVEWIKFFEWVA